MELTYNKILNNMKSAFYEKSGRNVDLQGDLGLRLQAVASEIYSVACFGEFVLRQAFPQTATGEYLDHHAQLRDMTRKTPDKARGILTFELAQACESDVEIPKSTVCSVKELPYIQFETDESAVIAAGETSVDVRATATEAGSSFNVGEGMIDVMVDPPLNVRRVINYASFTGGSDAESDEMLRRRIISSYSIPKSGVSADSLEELILKNDEIIDCRIYKSQSGGNIIVYVVTRNGSISLETENEIRNTLMIAKITGADISVHCASAKSYSLCADICLEGDSSEIREEITKILGGCTHSVRVGEALRVNDIISRISQVRGVKHCDVVIDQAKNGVVYCDSSEYLKCIETRVNYYE